MPIKIDGTNIPWRVAGFAVIAIFWLATLSMQVKANNDEIASYVPEDRAVTTEVKERLATIEANLVENKEEHKEIKVAQREQDEKLDRILQAVE